jgi:hypothetical protein
MQDGTTQHTAPDSMVARRVLQPPNPESLWH